MHSSVPVSYTHLSRLKESEDEREKFDQESKELISNISHDLKTPITTVKGYVEGIMDGVADTPEKMDRYIKTIYNKANDMDRLINELTSVSYTHLDVYKRQEMRWWLWPAEQHWDLRKHFLCFFWRCFFPHFGQASC